MIAIIAGSFDPPHMGHIDLIEQATRLFVDGCGGTVHVLVGVNTQKQRLITDANIVARLIRNEVVPSVDENIVVTAWLRTVVEYYEQLEDEAVIVRSLRTSNDCNAELAAAWVNNSPLRPIIQTVLLPCEPAMTHLSSSLVRELVFWKSPAAKDLVPGSVWRYLKEHFYG